MAYSPYNVTISLMIKVSLCRSSHLRRQPLSDGGKRASIQSAAPLALDKHHSCPACVLRSHPNRANCKSVCEWRIYNGHNNRPHNRHVAEHRHRCGQHSRCHLSCHTSVSRSIYFPHDPIWLYSGQYVVFSTSNPSFLLSYFSQQSSHRSQKRGGGGFLKIGKKSGNLNCVSESQGRGHCRHE